MILDDRARGRGAGPMTIDAVFRSIARRHPDALALVDPADRAAFTDGAPRRLTYAEADRAVTAFAERLRDMGLPADSIVGVQLPNVAENVLAILGILRAGMIAAPLPLLWRRADAVAALAHIGAKALVTCGHVGRFKHAQCAMRIAADVFSIRYVCAFGSNLPDGVVPLDDVLMEKDDPAAARELQDNATAHVAAVTFDITENGVVPVARNHAELFAGGLAVLLESRIAEGSAILSAIAPSSFAGICLTLLPWVLCGGTLVLHHPFDAAIFAWQRRQERCDILVLPGPLALRLAETAAFALDAPACMIAAWRAPERLADSAAWREADAALVDVSIFGEAAIVTGRRGADGKPAPLLLGPVVAPRGSTGATAVAELIRTDAGTLAVRGPMVPRHSFPPGIERSGLPHFRIGPRGLVDTGYTCRVDPRGNGLLLTGAPAGIVSVGGYRFPLRKLQDVVRRIDETATLGALPDPLIGQRLAGIAADRPTMQAALNAVGVNPLVVAAFRERREQNVSPRAALSSTILTAR
jgi:hypothetical protein